MKVRDFDWSAMVFELKRLGMSHNAICVALDNRITEAMIRLYMAGTKPAHWRGELLLNLWAERTGRSRGDAPTCAAPMSHASRGDRRRSHRKAVSPDALQLVSSQYNIPALVLAQMIARTVTQRRSAENPSHSLVLPGLDQE